jgi:hypothetical protein
MDRDAGKGASETTGANVTGELVGGRVTGESVSEDCDGSVVRISEGEGVIGRIEGRDRVGEEVAI